MSSIKLTFLYTFILSFSFLFTGCSTVLDITKADQIETNPNKRTRGIRLDDSSLRTIVKHNIAKAHSELDKSHIEIHSFNYVVLITGEVPTEDLKELARQTALDVANVRVVHNELTVRKNTSVISRINDTYLHKLVKLNIAREGALDGTDMDVVIQDSNAFLMGFVTREQGEVAAHVASLTSGIRSVVKVFEYLD